MKTSTVTRIRTTFSAFTSPGPQPSRGDRETLNVERGSFEHRNRPFEFWCSEESYCRTLGLVHNILLEVPGDRPAHFFPFVRMLPYQSSFLQLLFVASIAFAQNWKADPFVPPAIPLAVRTPYIQTWLRQGTAEGSLNSGWESFRDKSVCVRPDSTPPTVPRHLLADMHGLDCCVDGEAQGGQ